MSGINHPECCRSEQQEIEYVEKVDWLWQRLSAAQRSQIVQSVTDGTLRQESGKRCFIAEAIKANRARVSSCHLSLIKRILRIGHALFYDGPSYDFLFHAKTCIEDREKLNDIYYARIGNKEHQYQLATDLVRAFVTSLLLTVK